MGQKPHKETAEQHYQHTNSGKRNVQKVEHTDKGFKDPSGMDFKGKVPQRNGGLFFDFMGHLPNY